MMALFGFGSAKDKDAGSAPPLVLAYLEDAFRLRSPFVLKCGKQEIPATIHSISEDARTFRLLPDGVLKLDKGAKVEFTFIHEGLRLGGHTRSLEAREGIVVLALPDALALMERRRFPRARLSPKELATCTALQSLFEGVGITSSLENISEGGARIRVDKAISISNQKPLVLGTKLVAPGTDFMILKLNKLPKSPPSLETKGNAVYLTHGSDGLMMGLAFDKPPYDVESALRRLVASRTKPIPSTIPPKNRRPKEPEREPEPPPPPRVEPPPAPVEPPAAPAAPASSVASAAQAAQAAQAALEPSAAFELPPILEPPPESSEFQDPERESSGIDRRMQLRLSLGPGFPARFKAGGGLTIDVEMSDLSTTGCCMRLSPESCQGLQSGTVLEDFHFLHRDLPKAVLQARVSWILGKNAAERLGPQEGRYCVIAVEFLNPSQVIVDGLEAYIAWHL